MLRFISSPELNYICSVAKNVVCCVGSAEIQVEDCVYSLYKVGHKRGPKFLSYEGPSIETLDLFCEYFGSTPTL